MENTLQVFIAISQLLIAGLLLYIAWQNSRIEKAAFYLQKDKLRFDLFEKRFDVYKGFEDLFLSFPSIEIVGAPPSKEYVVEKFQAFVWKTKNSEFLFNKDIKNYREEIIDKTVSLMTVLNDGDKVKSKELLKWFDTQQDDPGRAFRKYLHFSIDKEPF